MFGDGSSSGESCTSCLLLGVWAIVVPALHLWLTESVGDQLNSAIAPAQTKRMHQYERDFGHTLDNRWSIPEMSARGKPYAAIAQHLFELEQALSTEYTDAILIDPQTWDLPAGAHGEDSGPT